MTVSELYHVLKCLVNDGKGDYRITFEDFVINVSNNVDIRDDWKEISLCQEERIV